MTQPQKNNFEFDLIATDGYARAGVFYTPHGAIQTPIFAPVGTQATVKSVSPQQLHELGVSFILSNTYHLYLRPGDELIAEMGGLHKFMSWDGPILTDSGGFQVFSLNELRKIDEQGVTFRSHLDGSTHRFTPERSIAIQENLGSDIIMAFDECSSPYDYEYSLSAMKRTHRWLERCVKAKKRSDQALFGIVQGGIFADLRTQSTEFVKSMDLPGIAIGGLSVGETKAEMNEMLDVMAPLLPEKKPRYLMGVGSPEDLVNGIWRGIDIFDCVLPTRLARHGAAMTRQGQMNLVNQKYHNDPRPIVEGCGCYCCRNFSRAYIRHLFRAKENLSGTLISIHNIHTLMEIVRDARTAILSGTYDDWATEFLAGYPQKA